MYGITDTAISFVRERALLTMNYVCKIERVKKPTFDQTTGRAVPGSRETIYEGPCRIWEASGGAPILVAEDEVVMQSTQLSLPWNASPLPRRDDEVQVTQAPTDEAMLGKRFVIDSSAKAGEMRATRRFQIRGYERS